MSTIDLDQMLADGTERDRLPLAWAVAARAAADRETLASIAAQLDFNERRDAHEAISKAHADMQAQAVPDPDFDPVSFAASLYGREPAPVTYNGLFEAINRAQGRA